MPCPNNGVAVRRRWNVPYRFKDNNGVNWDSLERFLQTFVPGPWVFGTGVDSAVLIDECNTAEGEGAVSAGYKTDAVGDYSQAWGDNSKAEGTYSAAFGESAITVSVSTTADGAFAEGNSQVFAVLNNADFAHAEGHGLVDPPVGNNADYAHAEGSGTAENEFAHAEGDATKAIGFAAHSEGESTTASGEASHAENFFTTATGAYSHAEGRLSVATGTGSHVEGFQALANDFYTHAEGFNTLVVLGAPYAHAEGSYAVAYSGGQHAHSSQFHLGVPAQYSRVTASVETTDATPTLLKSIGGSYLVQFLTNIATTDWNKSVILRGRVVARDITSTVVSSSWSFTGQIDGDGSSSYGWVAGITPTPVVIAQDASMESPTFAVAIISNTITVTVTGLAAHTIYWHCTLEMDEIEF